MLAVKFAGSSSGKECQRRGFHTNKLQNGRMAWRRKTTINAELAETTENNVLGVLCGLCVDCCDYRFGRLEGGGVFEASRISTISVSAPMSFLAA